MRKIFALVMAAALAVGFIPQTVQAAPIIVPEGHISVNGTGIVNVVPDIAHVSLGVETRDADARTAQALNSAQVDRLIATLRDMGIAEADIQTSNFFMWPIIDHGGFMIGMDMTTGGIIGYTVTNNVNVTIRDIDIVGDVLTAGIDAGANIGGGIRFALQDSTEAYNQALRLAIQDATEKAQLIASTIGRPLGSITSVSESGGFMPMGWSSFDSFGMGGRVMAAEAMATTPVEVGQITISANVFMTFTFAP